MFHCARSHYHVESTMYVADSTDPLSIIIVSYEVLHSTTEIGGAMCD